MTERTIMDIQRVYVPLLVALGMLAAVFMFARQLGNAEQALASVKQDIDVIDRRMGRMEDKIDRLLFVDSEAKR